MEQKNYTLKECRAFNQKSLELITEFTKESLKNGECKELILPDEAHPWKVLHSVIDQFYKREYDRVQAISIARCELEELKELRNDVRAQSEKNSQMLQEMIDLKEENYQLKECINQLQERAQEQPNALQEIINEYGIDGLIDITGGILDGLIDAVDQSGCNWLIEPMKHARALQGLFMKLEKELS